MKKKVLGLIAVVITILGININTYASESIYYTTPNGIELTKEEYEFLKAFYWDGYPDVMTQAQYERFLELDLLNREVNIKKTTIPGNPFSLGNTPRSPYYSDPAKTVQIGTACSTNCYTSLVAYWDASPFERSYDAYQKATNIDY